MSRPWLAKTLVMALCAVCAATGTVRADSARELVSEGNAAYADGKYDRALDAYEKAGLEKPESPHLYFNRGTAFYRKGDYAKAHEMFEQAALKARDLKLEARCKYNLGNCQFREGQRQSDSDLQKALDAYRASVRFYQDALELDPELNDAAHNIEVTRLKMKDLLDKLKRQQQEEKKEQEETEAAVEKLKELIGRQEETLERAEELSTQQEQEGDSGNKKKEMDDLASEQEAIRKDTQGLSEDLAELEPSRQDQKPLSPIEKARTHVESAATEQAVAAQRLHKQKLAEAKPSQEKALKELQDALQTMSGQQPAAAPQQPKERQQRKQQQKAEEREPEKGRRNETARDILNEEKENRRQRHLGPRAPGGYRPVEKDW